MIAMIKFVIMNFSTFEKNCEKCRLGHSLRIGQLFFKLMDPQNCIKNILLKTDALYAMCYRGVSGSLKVGGQLVLRQLWRRAAAAGGTFYSVKRGGAIAPPVTPLHLTIFVTCS